MNLLDWSVDELDNESEKCRYNTPMWIEYKKADSSSFIFGFIISCRKIVEIQIEHTCGMKNVQVV